MIPVGHALVCCCCMLGETKSGCTWWPVCYETVLLSGLIPPPATHCPEPDHTSILSGSRWAWVVSLSVRTVWDVCACWLLCEMDVDNLNQVGHWGGIFLGRSNSLQSLRLHELTSTLHTGKNDIISASGKNDSESMCFEPL